MREITEIVLYEQEVMIKIKMIWKGYKHYRRKILGKYDPTKIETNISYKIRVAGVVVLYHPDKDVIENISTYINQVGQLLIIDNSDIIDSKLIDKIKSLNNVNYISYGKNLGISSALNHAAKIAIEKGFKFLLTMDQDSKAPLNLVSSCISIFEGSNNVGLVTPIHGNKYGTHIRPVVGKTEKVTMAMTSGNLISLDVYKRLAVLMKIFP